MLKRTSQAQMPHMGAYAGARYWIAHFFYPNLYREYLSIQQARKVERHLRLQGALKANKLDIRNLLVLPVTDHAHPYKMEFPWERLYQEGSDPRGMTTYGKWYRTKIDCVYDAWQWHKFGVYVDDMVNARGWWNRAARTRCPREHTIHADRRVLRMRWAKDRYIFDPKPKWVHPADNTPFFGPYILMVADEWEEKWGFFAGAEVEY